MGNHVLLEARDLAFAYPSGTENVFSGASFRLYRGDRTALLGDNGSGKTTLLRLIAGGLEPSAGELALRGASAFLLRQEDSASGAGSALSWLREGLLESDDWDLAAELYAGAARLGFSAADLDRPVETFSGGERKMLALMAGFLRRPDLYLLDEPTNYLDAAAMARLSAELLRFKGGYIVVSHDRAFLDSCVEKVLELRRSEFAVYEGNYTSYAAQKEAEFELATKKKEKIEGQIAHLRVMERNYRDWGAAKEKEKIGAADKGFIGACAARLQKKSARAAERAREKIEELEREKPFVEKRRTAFLPPAAPAWLEASGLGKRLGDRTLFRDLSFNLRSGGRLALEGDNGAGKSTLMRILAGELEADEGTVRRGAAARLFYLPQFRPAVRAGARGRDYFPGGLLEAACNMLDHLGADGGLMFRPLELLSEGQRRKVELARLLVNGADIALLDEPTTHQDIRSVRVLEEALSSYAGILVLISHDAAFRASLPAEVLRL
jgi:ATPase subunit of ABC transporter with duplicated ATPase domains